MDLEDQLAQTRLASIRCSGFREAQTVAVWGAIVVLELG